MAKTTIFSFSFVLLFLLHCVTTLAQGPALAPALAPAPPGPTNVTKILEKAGQFTLFIRLLKATQVDGQIRSQLKNTDNAITIFAPSDSAFSGLKTGTLNSLNDQEKAELVQFHIVPTYMASSQFQTVSNPVRTQAGSGDRFQFNVTTTGNSVNITTGLTNTSVSGTVYTDNQLAVYQVDKVLLPLDLFTAKPPTPAPAPKLSPNKKSPAGKIAAPPEDASVGEVSFRMHIGNVLFLGVAVVAAIFQL